MTDKVKFKNVYEAENTIQELIKNDNNCSAHFRYTRWGSNGKNKLSIVTYNPKSETSFLLHSIELANNEDVEIYEYMYDHIINLKKTLEKKESPYIHYKISWWNNVINKTEMSFFYGENIEQILRKFYYEKSKNITIYSMQLMPQS